MTAESKVPKIFIGLPSKPMIIVGSLLSIGVFIKWLSFDRTTQVFDGHNVVWHGALFWLALCFTSFFAFQGFGKCLAEQAYRAQEQEGSVRLVGGRLLALVSYVHFAMWLFAIVIFSL